MNLIKAEFITSSANLKSCPPMNTPEFAFIGRSNVGKSSLINFITNRKKLAKVSQTPGKTRLINHFLINDQWYLVDLPGYGFARLSRSERESLEKLIYSYFSERKNIEHTFVLVDSRLEPQVNDISFMAWLASRKIGFTIVFTKSDKLSKGKLAKNMTHYMTYLTEFRPYATEIIPSSILDHSGKEEILEVIANYLDEPSS